MKLSKAKKILIDFPIIINYLAGGVWANLYDRFISDPQHMLAVLSRTPQFVNYIEKAVDYILVKDLLKTKNVLISDSPLERYYINFETTKPVSNIRHNNQRRTHWLEAPSGWSIQDFINNLQAHTEDSGLHFKIDSVVKKITKPQKNSIKYAYEIFAFKQPFSSTTYIDEDLF